MKKQKVLCVNCMLQNQKQSAEWSVCGRAFCTPCMNNAPADGPVTPLIARVQKKHRKQAKPLNEIETNNVYDGEQSPYWNFLRLYRTSESGELREYADANPDVLGDDQSFYHQREEDQQFRDLRKKVIEEVWSELSSQQQAVLRLCGLEGRTMQEAADELEITIPGVQTHLDRARAKLIRRYKDCLNDLT